VLTKLTVRNFKSFANAEIGLGNPVLFVGPDDSGKTTALQALALWHLGLCRWTDKRGTTRSAEPDNRPGVVINRNDLTGLPVPHSRHLWHHLNVRESARDSCGKLTGIRNIRIELIADGVTDGTDWSCGMEFHYVNSESFSCRPLRIDEDGERRMEVPAEAQAVSLELLGPMSRLAAHETKLDHGAIDVRLAEGRTAEVLRNLCWKVTELPDGAERWDAVTAHIKELFGARLDHPTLDPGRGELKLTYRTPQGSQLDLVASGRGMQQTLLLLAFLELHPGSVVLVDELGAHTGPLRQRRVYELLSAAAEERATQIIAASHSETMLEEAAARAAAGRGDEVVVFAGRPHPLPDKPEARAAIRDVGFDSYCQAESTGFVLYVAAPGDVAVLRALARACGHEAASCLERPFVCCAADQADRARAHFSLLRAAKPDLVGLAVLKSAGRGDHTPDLQPGRAPAEHATEDAAAAEDSTAEGLRAVSPAGAGLTEVMLPRRTMESYLLPSVTLLRYADELFARADVEVPARPSAQMSLFPQQTANRLRQAAEGAIRDLAPPAALADLDDRYWREADISVQLLAPAYEALHTELGPASAMRRRDYHRLARHLGAHEVHADVVSALDKVVDCASRARPRISTDTETVTAPS